MPNWLDIAYGMGVGLSAPLWSIRPRSRRKVLRALRERMGNFSPESIAARDTVKPAILIHAVSLGEMNATRGLVEQIGGRRPGMQFVISTTTDTGFARGNELYADDARVIVVRYPLDFRSAVVRALDALKVDLVVLMELEVWPNFTHECGRRNIPILLVNGRMTPRSFRQYRAIKPFIRPMFARLAAVCVQDAEYGRRFVELGCSADRVQITGTMKFDTAKLSARIEGDAELAGVVGLPLPVATSPAARAERVWVVGSSGPGEELIVLRVYRQLLKRFVGLRLVIVPRKPERFDEVADLIRTAGFDLIRRSEPRKLEGLLSKLHGTTVLPAVILGDSVGELRKFYSLADVVLVGRTLVDLGQRQHGSDMIEPAALGKPVIVGRYTGNFAEAMNAFRSAGAIIEVSTEAQLAHELAELLRIPDRAESLGKKGRQVVTENRGATMRNVETILCHLEQHRKANWVAVMR